MKIEFCYLFAFLVTLVAAVTDYKKGKIFNTLTIPFMIAAFFISTLGLGHSFQDSLFGFLVATVLFIPLFGLRVFGAGDGKLMMGLGAFFGMQPFLDFFVLTLAITGVGAVVLLIKHRRVKVFLRQMILFARSVFVPNLKLQWPKLREDIKAPFGVVVSIAFLVMWMKQRSGR